MPDPMERACALRKSRTRNSETRIFRFGSVFACCLLACIATASAGERQDFDIHAGPAAQTLNQYALQAGVELGFPVDEIGFVRTNPVKGQYEPAVALDLLLQGTGLSATSEEGRVLVSKIVSPPEYSPSGRGKQAEHGEDAAGAATGGQEGVDASRKSLEEIVVTGTNIRGAGNVGTTAISFDRAELAATGFATVEDLFESLPQNLDEITPIGAVASGASDLAGFNSLGVTAVNLRGLGPGSTLVLLNGKRRPGNINGRAVDISAVPLSMVERIDVITGGYSAVYGSDAVAGVVNLATRRSFDGAESQVYYGQSSVGGERFNVSQSFGREFAGGGFVLGYDYRRERPIDATETGVLLTPSREGVTPIPGLFHLRGAAEQHVGLLAGHFLASDGLELYLDAQVAVEDYENELAYSINTCCDVESRKVTDGEQYSAVIGARADAGADWVIDVSALHGEVDNSGGAASAVVVPAGTITSETPRPPVDRVDHDNAELSSFSVVADGPLHIFRQADLSAAVGVDLRRESYIRQRTPLSTSAVETFENIDRDVRSLFSELHVPVGDNLRLSLAGRYDDYSDFGDTINPQVGMEWRATNSLNLRGTFSRAFRAPDLFDLASESRVRILTLVDPLDPTGQTTATVLNETGGNPGLQPEEADTWSVGFDWDFSEHARLSVSYFNIRYDGRIDVPDPFGAGFQILENEHLYPNLIDRSPTPERVSSILDRVTLVINDSGIPFDPATDDAFEAFSNIVVFDNRSNNIALETMDGFDLEASASWETPSGDWSAGLNGSYYLQFERNITATSPAVDQLNQPGRPVDLRLRGYVGWVRNAWNARLYVNYVDGYYDNIVEPPVPIDSWMTADLSVGLDASRLSDSSFLAGLKATLGVLNVFDDDPPVLLNDGFGLGYDAINANAVGRYVSLRLSKRW